jgi:hypothetical protein
MKMGEIVQPILEGLVWTSIFLGGFYLLKYLRN